MSVLLQLPQVGDHEIHAEQLRLREHHTGINQDGRAAAGDDHHVHAELAKPAERDHIERRYAGSRDHATGSTRMLNGRQFK